MPSAADFLDAPDADQLSADEFLDAPDKPTGLHRVTTEIGRALTESGGLIGGLAKAGTLLAVGEPDLAKQEMQAWADRNMPLPPATSEKLEAEGITQPSPWEAGRQSLPLVPRAAAGIGASTIESLPQLAAAAVIPGGAAAFGFNKEGFDPVQAATAMIAPYAGKYLGNVASQVAKKAGITSEQALEAIDRLGGAAGVAGIISAPTVAEISQMEPGEARNTAIEAAGANAVLMGILGAAHTPESERAPGRGKAPIDLIRQKRLGQAAKAMSQEVDAAEFLNSEPGAVTQTVPQQTPPEGVYRTTRGFRASEPPSDQPPIIPAPVAPTAPAAGAASKPTLTPALMVDDKPITGGKSHAEIAQAAMARAMATKDPADIDLASKLVDAKENDADHVFVDADGQVLTRDQAKPVLEQITGKPVIEPVQSYHVPESALGDTSFKPTVTPETKTTTPETKNAQGRTPEDFGKHIGATFDQSFKWDGKDFHQFTWREKDVPKDNPLYGATFSIPADATPEQALAAAKAKAADFGVPNYKQESPVKKIEEKQPQVKPTPLNKNEVKPENVNQAPVEKPTTDKPTETEVIPPESKNLPGAPRRLEVVQRGMGPTATWAVVDHTSGQEISRFGAKHLAEEHLADLQGTRVVEEAPATPPAEVPPTKTVEAPFAEPPPATTTLDPSKIPTQEIPLKQLKLSKDVPNFKSGAREDTGTVAGQELSGKYQRTGTAPVVVWERLNGDKEIITGRHRYDLAKRTKEKTIPAQIVREADGFTKDMAITFDAEANIRDGQGEVNDYATYFKNTYIDEAEARARGLLSRTKGQAGWSLAKAASDDVYSLWRGGKLTDAQAVAIADAAPGDAAAQRIGSKFGLQGKTPDFISNVIKATKLATKGGGEEMDLFGGNDAAMKQMEAQAERASQAQKDIRSRIQVLNAGKKTEISKSEGIDVKNPAAIPERMKQLRGELDRWQNWPLHPDLVEKVKGTEAPVKFESAKIESANPLPPKNLATAEQIKTSASRFRPREVVHFDKPLVGPSGAKLVAYEWKWMPEEYVDKRGEDKVRRVSNWENAEGSSQTGRDIVHQFQVVTPDGVEHLVSAESVPQMLGYAEKGVGSNLPSLVSATKTLAKLRMQMAIVKAKADAWKAAKDQADKERLPNIEYSGPQKIEFGTRKGEVIGSKFKVGDYESTWSIPAEKVKPEQLDWKERASLESAWRWQRAETLANGAKASDIRVLNDLERRSKLQQKKIDALIADKTESPKPTPPKGELFAASETPFNLAGETQKFVEPTKTTTAHGDEILTQHDMFAIADITQDVDPFKSARAAEKMYGAEAAKKIRNQLRVMDSDPQVKRSFTKEQRQRLAEVLNVLEQGERPGSEAVSMGMLSTGDPNEPVGKNQPEPTVGFGGDIYGVAQRVRDARSKAGQVAPVATGEGVSDVAAVDWGRELLASGADPEKALQDIERTGAVSFDGAAVTRAHGEALAKAARNVEESEGTDSTAYRTQRKALDDWDTRTKALGTIWHKVGMTMQGKTDLDTGSFSAIQRAFTNAHDGQDMTPKQEKEAKELVAQTQKLEAENKVLLARLDAEIGKQAVAPKVETVEPHVRLVADKLKEYFESRAKKALENIKERKGRGMMFADPTAIATLGKLTTEDLVDYADYGASKIFEMGIQGAEMTAEWADAIKKDFGKNIEPHLKELWDASLKTFLYGFKKVVPQDAETRQKVKRAVKPKAPVDPAEVDADKAAEDSGKAATELTEAKARAASTPKPSSKDPQKKAAQQAIDAAHKTVREAAARAAEAETKARVAKAKAAKATWAKSVDATRSTMAEPKVSGKFSQEQVGALWEYVKKTHIDQGNTDFGDIVQKTATELGMAWKDVATALGQSKTTKNITDALYRKQTDRRRIQETAKRWVQSQGNTWLGQLIPSAARKMFGLKVFGHGTVGFGTHAPLVAFMPQYAKVYYRDFGKMYSMVFDQARYEQEVQALKSSRNYEVAQRNGLVNDPFKVEDFNDPRMAQYYGRLSGAGNRGYFALKILRQDMFDQGWEKLPENLQTDDMAKVMSDSINHLTGVVKSKSGGSRAHLALFAPRLLASRAAFLFGDPAKAAVVISKLVKTNWKDLPEHEKFIVRNEVATKATIAATACVLLEINNGILQAVGSDQQINTTDPTRSDWMKFKTAGMTFSFGNPVLNMARLPLRLWTIGRGDGGKLKHVIYPDEDMTHAVEEFGRTQLSPLAALAADFMFKGDYQNRPLPHIPGYGAAIPVPKRLAAQGIKPYTWPEFAAQTMLPIWANEVVTDVWRHGFGMSEAQIKAMGKALLATAVQAGTGGRLSEDTQPKKNVMQQ